MSAIVVWITGLPQSGKSTLGRAVRDRLRADDIAVCVLDSDDVRAAVVPARGYTPRDRAAHYETLARLAALVARQDVVAIVPATSHRRAWRDTARTLVESFIEVYASAPATVCAERDIKRLYARARAGELGGLPGIDLPYEPPSSPAVTAAGGLDDAAVDAIVAAVHAARDSG